MTVRLDVKDTIHYLIKQNDGFMNYREGSDICNEVFAHYHSQTLNSVGKMFKIIYFLKVIAEVKFKNIDQLITTENSAFDLLLTKMGTDIIGPKTRFGTAKIDYFYGNTHFKLSLFDRLKKYINNLFAKNEEQATFFELMNSALKYQLSRKKAELDFMAKNPREYTEKDTANMEQDIVTLKESMKLSKHLQLNIQGLIHEASAIRKLHLLAKYVDLYLKNSATKEKILNNIEQLAKAYYKHCIMDYSFSQEEGMSLGENKYTISEVLNTRGKEVTPIYNMLDWLIDHIKTEDFLFSSNDIDNLSRARILRRFKNFLHAHLNDSWACFSVKSEINEQLSIDDGKLAGFTSKLSLSLSWAGIAGSLGLVVGGTLSFTPFTVLGQAIFYPSLALTLLSLTSTACSATKGLVFDPIKYRVPPKKGDLISLSGVVFGLTITRSLKLLSSKEILGGLSLAILSAADSGIKIPLQMKSSSNKSAQLKLKADHNDLRSDVFQFNNLSPDEILKLAQNFLKQNPQKFERILEVMRETHMDNLGFSKLKQVRSKKLPLPSIDYENTIKFGESSHLLLHSPRSARSCSSTEPPMNMAL